MSNKNKLIFHNLAAAANEPGLNCCSSAASFKSRFANDLSVQYQNLETSTPFCCNNFFISLIFAW